MERKFKNLNFTDLSLLSATNSLLTEVVVLEPESLYQLITKYGQVQKWAQWFLRVFKKQDKNQAAQNELPGLELHISASIKLRK